MPKKPIAAFLLSAAIISAVALAACSNSNSQANRAGKILAEMNCAMLSGGAEDALANFTESNIEAIITKNGFADNTELEAYLSTIKDTEEQNEVSVSVRTNLQELCGEELEAIGLSAADLAESVMGN